MNFLSYLINGISLGSVYAIIALGYTMVYGIAKMLNFAHGDVIMIGCYVVFLAMSGQGISPLPAVVLSIIVCTVLGIVVEKIAYKPLRRATSAWPCSSQRSVSAISCRMRHCCCLERIRNHSVPLCPCLP